jgi:hypothetical protein
VTFGAKGWNREIAERRPENCHLRDRVLIRRVGHRAAELEVEAHDRLEVAARDDLRRKDIAKGLNDPLDATHDLPGIAALRAE